MSTNKNTGVRNHNTNMAPAVAGSGVTVNPSAVEPPVAPSGASPGASSGASPGVAASTALASFGLAFKPIFDALAPSISRPPPGVKVTIVHAAYETVASQVAALARRHPELALAGDPGIIEADLATLAAARSVSTRLNVAQREVDDTGRMAFAAGYEIVHAIVHRAEALAKDDKTLAEELAAIRAPLRKGPNTTAAERVAAAAARTATRTQSRAAKAQQKAAAASQAATATAAAHAARHPAVPDVVIVPAGSTPNGTPPKG